MRFGSGDLCFVNSGFIADNIYSTIVHKQSNIRRLTVKKDDLKPRVFHFSFKFKFAVF